MLQWQFILLTFTSLLLVDKITTAPLEEDVDDDLEDLTDDHIGYDTYARFKRQEVDTDTLDWKSLPKIPKCMAGEYFSKCTPCAMGYYKPSKARKLCAKCPDGKGTPAEGAKWCTKLCKEGKKLTFDAPKGSERLCEDCEIGTYRPEPNVNYTCIHCPKGWTTDKNGSKSFSDCFLSCGLGMQPNNNKTGCEKCPEGTFGKKVGPDMCQICPKNKTTVEDGASEVGDCQKPCDPGKLYNTTSGKCDIRCPKGTYKDEISSRWTECKQCPKNYVPNKNGAATGCDPNCGPGFGINGNKCSPCGFGSYKTTTGNTQCDECPGSMLTLSTGGNTPENCSNFNPCAKPLIMDIEALYDVFEEKKGKSENLVDLMINVCSFGPNDRDVQLLESVVSRFPTCGVVGQLNLSDIEVAGKIYKKEDYFKIFQEAYHYGGLCEFVSCLDRSVPEIKKSKTWIRNDSCPSTEKKCFCSETYRALATSFHTNLQKCPALQFHQEFLAIDIGGKEMIAPLLDADNITSFCDLSNACASAFCGNGSCTSLSSGGFKCKCWFGYTGDHCLTPQPSTDETEPETTTPRSTPVATESTCKPCPTQQTTTPHECPTLTCPTPEPCDECPTQTPCPVVEPCSTPPPCEECPTQTPCPTVDCPTPTPCPDIEPCSTPPPCDECPTQTPCPVVDCPTQTPCPIVDCPTPTPCPTVDCPTPPPPEPCDECPTPTPCPTSTPCPTVTCPTAPPPTPCECPTQTPPTPCPTTATESPATHTDGKTTTPSTGTSPSGSTHSSGTSTETTRCQACNIEFLRGFILSGNDVCSEAVYHTFGCYYGNGCSEAHLQENAYLFSDHIPSMGFNWHTYFDVEESLHAYCQSATHTDGKTTIPSTGTSSPSGSTHSSGTSTETTRCQACNIEFLRGFILSGNDVCSEAVYHTFGCYYGNGCSEAYLQENAYLFSDHIPSMGFNWHTYFDVEESLHAYCQSAMHTDGTSTTSSFGTSSTSGTTHSSQTSTESARCHSCDIAFLQAVISSGNDVCSEIVFEAFFCYLANECSEAYLQEKYYLYSDHIPFMGFHWHTYHDVDESLHAYCQSATHTDGTTTTPSSGTTSTPGTTHSSGTATETERCEACDIEFLQAVWSTYTCSESVLASFQCYHSNQCSENYLQRKYSLYTIVIPDFGSHRQTYHDLETSWHTYCFPDGTEPPTMPTAQPTTSAGTITGQTGVTGMPIQGVSCKSSTDTSCTYYGGACQEVFASVWICFCPNSAPYFNELQQMCVSGTPADGTTTTTSSGTSSHSGTTTAKPTDGSAGTSSPSESTYSSGITCAPETETTRCQVCDLNFLEAFISSWYDVCSATVDSSLECYFTSGCPATYLQEKYSLYSGIIPGSGLPWSSYHDVAESLNQYCSTVKTTDDTTGSSGNTPSTAASYPSTGTSYSSTGSSYPSSKTTHSSGTTSATDDTGTPTITPSHTTGSTRTTTDIPDECDIRINNCPGSEQCVLDGMTSRTFCSCVEYGKNPITGECMTYMEQMDFFETGEKYCDPGAKYPCHDYYMECTKTDTELHPTCKCVPGYRSDGINTYCSREPSATLTSICDPNAPFPCENEHDMECKQSAGSADYRCTCKEGWIADGHGWCQRGEGSLYSQCDSSGTCSRNLICNHGYCECPEGYLSFDESSCVIADGKTLNGHCRMWSICDVDHSKCYYDYNNKDNSNYCKCLFGYQDSGKNTCVKIAATKEECKTDYTNCKSEENKECFSTHVQFEGKPEPIQLCECKAGFKRADGNTCELDSPTDDSTVSSSKSSSTAPYSSTGTSYSTTRTSYTSSETVYSSGSSTTDGTETPTITPSLSTGSTKTTTEETEGPCNPNPCGNGQCVPTVGTIYYDCLCDEGFRYNGAHCVLDLQDECDIRKNNCPGLEQCVVDDITSRTFCSCVEYGKHPTTGECMTYMDQMEFFENGERYCDPEAKYPCHDYYMECTKTDTEFHPTCKCEPGYYLDGVNTYCTREPSANLTSICDPKAPFPCENEYDMECKQSADSADYRCTCKEGFIPDGRGWCQRGEGSMYSQCDSNGTCSRNLRCNHGYCECPEGYSSFDESSCVLADGYTLGGHCYMWGICHVENSKCFYGFTDKTSSNYCRCLFGYQDSGKNTCVKIPDKNEECKSDYTNCKSEENKECFSTHVKLEGKLEPIQLCECKADFKKADGDACELDPSSCGFCYQEFERVLYVSASKHGCSQNMSEVIQCFTHNCNEEEFEKYRDNWNMNLFMYEYSISALDDLRLTYNEYCAGNIIGQGCNVDQCQTKNSYCDTGVSPAICRCQHSYTKNFEASQCLSIYMADHQCSDNYGCSHVNGICLQNLCTCADGYKYDVYSQTCASMKNIGDECNVHLSSPCRTHSWLPRCEYDPNTCKSTCQCWTYGINATTLTCADQPAGANKKCNIDTEEKCQHGAECDEESGLCKCKEGYNLEHYGYCSIGYSGVLDKPCNTTAPTCIGTNVGCINNNCDCISDEYYKNHYDLTCYHISEEDGNVGSPCEHTMTCNDPNAKCEYVTNSIRKCMCDYGYKTVAGACEKEIDIPDDCEHVPCNDENAECKYQDIFYEQRSFTRHFCVCKNGYGRTGCSEKCKPVNCDGCYEEFLKMDLASFSTVCRKEIYSVLSCADQHGCSVESNFVRILSSTELQHWALDLTDLDTLKSSLKARCDGNTLDGPCDVNYACSYDLGLKCIFMTSDNEGTCKCAQGFGEYFGTCLELNSKDSDEECDIGMNSCTDMKTCVLDGITNTAHCQCITYGRNIETGECRDNGAMNNEHCDPDAFNPCADYSAECNRTDAVTIPVCKCRKGYLLSSSGFGTCEWQHQSQLNEQCNPNADYPCMDNYQTECKRYGKTEEYRCQCKDDYEMDENNWCRKKNGLLYGNCNNGLCNHPFVCKYESCQCPENHTSVDQTTCAPAYGTALGGHCKDYSWCFVEHSICNYESYACHCLFGYRESEHNTCERVPGVKEECLPDASNCRFTDNKECLSTYVTFGQKPQQKQLCECVKGFKMTDDGKCEPDTSSCAYCYKKFETALSITSSKYGCSKNMSAAIQCFNENCNQQELELYTMDISSQLGMYNAEEDLVSAYSYYCAGYIIEQHCDASGMCHVPETECDSSAANNLCQCRQSFSANLEASQCVSDYLPDQHCIEHWECSQYNALCIGSLCLCPHGYTFDKFSQACESTSQKSLNDECNRHLSRPCNSHSWLPQCQYDPETDKTTCQCWTYGFNSTSQTCADNPAKANEPCNVNAASINDECTTGAECNRDISLCKCKDGHSLTTDGHCSFDHNSVGILDQSCDETNSCKGDNVICNASRICDCISSEYHKNSFDHTCYKLSEEDGNLNSPCDYSKYCYDPNAWCEWTYSGLQRCMCNYGYANVDGVCEKIEDCYETPCADENAMCSGFEIFSDGRYDYRSYCLCNPGYKRSSPTEECRPADCDGCFQEFLKLPLIDTHCQDELYSVLDCAMENKCSDKSNFAKVLTSSQAAYLHYLDLTSIDSLLSSFNETCGENDVPVDVWGPEPIPGIPISCFEDAKCTGFNAKCSPLDGFCHCMSDQVAWESVCVSADCGRCWEDLQIAVSDTTDRLKHECSLDISQAIDCFINNCDQSEFLLYSNEIDDLMLPDGYYSSSVSELKWVYYSYMCVNYLINRECSSEGSPCEIPNSACKWDLENKLVCTCDDSLTIDTEGNCVPSGTPGTCPAATSVADFPTNCDSPCGPGNECVSGYMCCYTTNCATSQCVYPLYDTGDGTASHSWGAQISGTNCLDDTDCTMYNAKCPYGSGSSCFCSANQLLDGMICRDGECPDYNKITNCENVNECFTNDGCENGQICCHSICGEHCVTPKFYSESCASCLEEFNSLDLSIELCQIGGYSVKECSSNHGCNEQTVFADVLTAPKLLQYDTLLNFTNLDALGNSYQWACDGNVAGGPCEWYQDCNSSLGLFCNHPDGYSSENSICQCMSGVPDHLGRHCLDTSITVETGLHCGHHSDCFPYNAYCDIYGTGQCHCSITEPYIAAEMMCQPTTGDGSATDLWGPQVPGTTCMAESECTMYNAKCHYGPSSYGSCYCSANQLLDDMTMMCRDDGDDAAGQSWGAQIPGTSCMGDTECTSYNAKCYHSASAEMSCYCSVDQMLDGMMCIDGVCPDFNEGTPCGSECYTDAWCGNGQICCHSGVCGEHCVLPRFNSESCASCLEDFNSLDLSTELCQIGGYSVKECSSNHGCNEQTVFADILTAPQLLQYDSALNFTNLDALGNSYQATCDGKVAGGPCLWHQDCDSSLGLFCDHPDGYPSENSRCQCISGVPDHFGRHCLDTSITIDGGRICLYHSECSDYNAYCDNRYGEGYCHCSITEPYREAEMMCQPTTGENDVPVDVWGPEPIPGIPISCFEDAKCTGFNAKCSPLDGFCHCMSDQVAWESVCVSADCGRCWEDLQIAVSDTTARLKHECSGDISRAIDCFINNCDQSEFLLYSNEIDDLMLPDGFYSSSVSELKWVYYSYMCVNYLINQECSSEGSPCEIPNSICKWDLENKLVCTCDDYLTIDTEGNCVPSGTGGTCPAAASVADFPTNCDSPCGPGNECVSGYICCYTTNCATNQCVYPLYDTEDTVPGGFKRTIILMHFSPTSEEEQLFIRGGYSDCAAAADSCDIPIVHRPNRTGSYYTKLNDWNVHDYFLDWYTYGPEPSQGFHEGQQAKGTPALRVTDIPNEEFIYYNSFGPDMWLVDFYMLCDSTTGDGWFELKSFVSTGPGDSDGYWENSANAMYMNSCYDGPLNPESINHKARCGMMNIFFFGVDECILQPIEEPVTGK